MQCKGGFKEEEHLKGTVRDYNIHNIDTNVLEKIFKLVAKN